MNTKAIVTLIAACVFVPFTSRAEGDSFPKADAEYFFEYTSPKPMIQAGGKPSERLDSSIRLKLIQIQPNGWVLASRIDYDYTYSGSSHEITGKKRKLAPPSWYNLQAFSHAVEMKED